MIPGDFLSYEAYSYWGNVKNITIKEEHKKGFKFLERITKLFPWIVIFDGNHEERARRFLENKNEVVGLSPHISYKAPLMDIVKYFDNISYVPNHFVQLGDFVFGHPKRYSSIPMRTAVNFLNSLIGRAHQKKFGKINGVGIGHTHKGGKISHKDFGVMEFGYLANVMDYFKHRQTKEKWERGYGIVKFEDGKFQYNQSDFIKTNS